MTYWHKRNVLVTGGLGFIGSNLVMELWRRGAHVTVVDSLHPNYGGNRSNLPSDDSRLSIVVADLRDKNLLEPLVTETDVIFNLAGQSAHLDSIREPELDLDNNLRGHISLLEACRHHNPEIRVVLASTRQVYGRPQSTPVNESHPISPVDVNGINKYASEQYHLLYSKLHGVRTTVLRLTNTYGPRMRVKDARQTFLGVWIKLALDQRKFEVFGSGLQMKDFNFVDDVVEAMLLVGSDTGPKSNTYNLGAEKSISLLETANRLSQLAGGPGFDIVPFPDELLRIDIGDYSGDYSSILRDYGWHPRTTFEQGLQLTLDFFREARGR